MDLRQLRYFVTVARERNFTRAAEKLHIAQPPLSRQIQLLEEELGVSLLSRESRPIALTEAGRMFYEQSLQVLSRVEQLKSATQKIGRSERSVLSIGIVPSVLYGDLPALLRRLRQARPDIEFQLVEMMSLPQVDALRSGRIDIGFGRVRAQFPDIHRVVLREERLVLACAADSAFAAQPFTEPVALADIAEQRLVVYPKAPRPSFADQVLGLVERHQIEPREVQEVNELQTALGMVAAGVGVSIVPASARTLRSDLHFRLLDDEQATSPIIMSYRASDSSPTPALVMQLLQDIYAEKPEWSEYSYY